MKIFYIANARMPTEKAHGIQIMKMCEAFADAGATVELVLPRRFNFIKKSPFEYYGVKKNFNITKLPSLDLVRFGKIGFLIQSLSFAGAALGYVMFKKADIIYSRDELPLFLLGFFKKNIVWEAHAPKWNFAAKSILKKRRKIIAITRGLKNFYAEKGAEENNIFIAPDGVDTARFGGEGKKSEAREKLKLPQGKKIAVYTGHLYAWKGADTLIKSAEFLGKDILVYLAGGTAGDIARVRKELPAGGNIVIAGARPHSEISDWQRAADALILPNTAKDDVSKYYTSPMKLFEYMASGTPIVSSDLPSIREILNESNSILVEPDNPEALAAGIERALNDKELAEKISKRAFADAQNHTWEKRAKRILAFIAGRAETKETAKMSA